MKLLVLAFIIPLALGLTFQEDDLVFDDVSDDSQPISSASPLINQPSELHQPQPPQLQSHPSTGLKIIESTSQSPFPEANVTTTVGHVFRFKVPKHAFGGSVNHYEIRSSINKPLPHWLFYDEATTTLLGVPAKKDVGQHHLSIKAYYTYGDVVESLFTIKVLPEKTDEVKHKDGKTHCRDSEEQTLMSILLDVKFDDLKPVKKVNAIEKLASNLGLHVSAFSMHGRSSKEESASEDSRVILTGPGNVKRRKEKHSTSIQWQVGCDGHLWKHQAELVKQIKKQAKDKTLAKVIQLPVFLWRVKTFSNDLIRSRREAGSGDYGRNSNRNHNNNHRGNSNNNNNDNDDDYDDDNYDYDESYDEDRDDRDDLENEPITTLPPRPIESVEESHPHRHHHGQDTSISIKAEEEIDEHDIIPIIDRKFPESSPSTSTPTPTSRSTTEQTSTTLSTPQEETPTTPAPPTVSTVTVKTEPEEDATTDINDIISENNNNNNSKQPTLEETEFDTETDTDSETTVVSSTFLTTLPTSSTISASTEEIKATTTAPSTTAATVFAANDTIDEDFEFTENASEYPTVLTEITPLTTTPSAGTDTTELQTSPTPVSTSPATSTESPTKPMTAQPSSTTSPTPATPSTTFTPSTTTTTTTTPIPTTTTTVPPPTTVATTTEEVSTTEKVVYRVRNYPPRQDRRLEKIRVTAGKPLSYFIPTNTFSDIEDGDTRNLRLSLFLKGSSLKNTHWLQFNQQTQEVYGLPLNEHVSVWNYDLVAADREGLNVSDRLDIYVQQHKLTHSANHDFSIYLRIDKRSRFPTSVDWELKIIQALAQLYGDKDPSSITVRTIQISEDQAVFTWTNDTVPPSSECPKDAINRLYHVLVASNDGDPSSLLQHHLGPEIRVKRVAFQGHGQCEYAFSKKPQAPEVSTQEPKVNDPPMPRNQVDHLTAQVGQLLIFRVPEDTFYDPEDGPTRHLRLSLLHGDRSAISPDEWLQFDVNNQEFYGVPMKTDPRRREYQLIAVDKEGAAATDNLVLEVKPAEVSKASAEFTIKLGVDYDAFITSAMMKKNFILRLRDLFGDKNTDAISLMTITQVGHKNTMITWRNTTLPTEYCPNKEIQRLSEVLFVKPDNKELTNRIERIMGMEFPVDQLTLTPMGICLGEFTRVHSHDGGDDDEERGGRRGSGARGGADNDDYLITFVLPAIIIAAMLVLAGIIACILYRRKRSGKMSVSEHADERQSFRSKGIPVIFQDELEEKPEPGDKAPVILKEEKPPLPPPEYLRANDGADQPMLSQENSEEPYQPPPPFARTSDTTRQNRPKPTPTYRKPPPYVPP